MLNKIYEAIITECTLGKACMKSLYLLIFINLLISFNLAANQNTKITVNCTDIPDNIYDSRFKNLRKVAIETNKNLCSAFLQSPEDYKSTVRSILVNYSMESKDILTKSFKLNDFPIIEQQFSLFNQELLKYDLADFNNLDLDTLSVGGIPRKLYFSNIGATKGSDLPTNKTTECSAINPIDNKGNNVPYVSCKEAFEDAALAFNAYKFAYNQFRYSENESKINYLSQQWDSYLTNSRSQTFLDIWLTTVIHSDHYQQNKLVAPASTQYFLFRPQVVYEFSSDTRKGDRNQIGLAAEWIGINWWNWKVPFGVSAISVYADYEEENSVGHGLQFTINNNISLGWVKRGSSDAIFVSIDLLKLWDNKKEQIKQYQKEPWAWIK